MSKSLDIVGKSVTEPVIILNSLEPGSADLLPNTINLPKELTRIIQNESGIICHPFGSIMRSIIFSIYELEAKEVYVMGRQNGSTPETNVTTFPKNMLENEQFSRKIKTLQHAGIHIDKWLEGTTDLLDNLRQSVHMIQNHPLIPDHVVVHGLFVDPQTGKVDIVINGNHEEKAMVTSF